MATKAFDKSKPRPTWLDKEYTNKNSRRGIKYYRHLFLAQPVWANVTIIRAIYRACKKLGRDYEVDHIVPLNHPLVCGLHVPWNLRIIKAEENRRKSNNVWPDMPYQQGDLFEHSHASEEFYLV